MSKTVVFVSATFVLIFLGPRAVGSPDSTVPAAPAEDIQPARPPDENMSISQPPPIKVAPPPADPEYYPYRQAMIVRFGVATDTKDLDHTNDYVFGFAYQFPKFLSPTVEAGADLHDQGIGHLHAEYRWIWDEKTYMRPALIAGGDFLCDSHQGLATFGYINNLYFLVGAAVDRSITDRYSLRAELDLLAGFRMELLELTVGVTRGW